MCERNFCSCAECRRDNEKRRENERPYLVAKYGRKTVEHWDKLYKERVAALDARIPR